MFTFVNVVSFFIFSDFSTKEKLSKYVLPPGIEPGPTGQHLIILTTPTKNGPYRSIKKVVRGNGQRISIEICIDHTLWISVGHFHVQTTDLRITLWISVGHFHVQPTDLRITLWISVGHFHVQPMDLYGSLYGYPLAIYTYSLLICTDHSMDIPLWISIGHFHVQPMDLSMDTHWPFPRTANGSVWILLWIYFGHFHVQPMDHSMDIHLPFTHRSIDIYSGLKKPKSFLMTGNQWAILDSNSTWVDESKKPGTQIFRPSSSVYGVIKLGAKFFMM